MALKLIPQDVIKLREAYDERKAEYDALRAVGRWPGAILLAGTLLDQIGSLQTFWRCESPNHFSGS